MNNANRPIVHTEDSFYECYQTLMELKYKPCGAISVGKIEYLNNKGIGITILKFHKAWGAFSELWYAEHLNRFWTLESIQLLIQDYERQFSKDE